jgi:hypothetical protein
MSSLCCRSVSSRVIPLTHVASDFEISHATTSAENFPVHVHCTLLEHDKSAVRNRVGTRAIPATMRKISNNKKFTISLLCLLLIDDRWVRLAAESPKANGLRLLTIMIRAESDLFPASRFSDHDS